MLALWENNPTRTSAACDQNDILFHCTPIVTMSQQNTVVLQNILYKSSKTALFYKYC